MPRGAKVRRPHADVIKLRHCWEEYQCAAGRLLVMGSLAAPSDCAEEVGKCCARSVLSVGKRNNGAGFLNPALARRPA